MNTATSVATDAEIPATNNVSLRASMRDGMAAAVMVGCGETFLSPFGIHLGASTLQVGLLSTVPLLVSALAQNASVLLLEKYRERKKLLNFCVSANALIWLPLALLAIVGSGENAATILIVLAALYHATSGLCLPAWNSLMGDLVPKGSRGAFFGRRNRWGSLMTFLAMFAAGKLLWLFQTEGKTAWGYAVIFCIAASARLISGKYIRRLDDSGYVFGKEHRFTFFQFIAAIPRSNFARFVLFSGLVNFGVSFAAPYFTLYMLRDLKLTYSQFTILTASMMAAQFLTMQHWGRLIDQFGNKNILNFCGYGICLAPTLWLFSSNFYFLMAIQLYSGFIWSGYNLACANFIFDAVSAPKLPRCVAYHALVNNIFFLLGSLAGGYTGTHIGEILSGMHPSLTLTHPLLVVFGVSGLIRLGVVRLLMPRFKEVRTVPPVRNRELVFQIVDVRPIAGATFQVLTKLKRQ